MNKAWPSLNSIIRGMTNELLQTYSHRDMGLGLEFKKYTRAVVADAMRVLKRQVEQDDKARKEESRPASPLSFAVWERHAPLSRLTQQR